MSWSIKRRIECCCERCGLIVEIGISNYGKVYPEFVEEQLQNLGWYVDPETKYNVCPKCKEQKERKNVKK